MWEETQVATYCDKKVKVAQSFPTLCDLVDYTVHGTLQARILEWSAFPFSRGSSQLRDGTQVSHIAGRFFTSWTTREAQDTRVGSLSLLQRIFLSQVLNQGLLHCRWILYQLSYQGSPYYDKSCTLGGFLVVQWLRPGLPMQGVPIWSLVVELRSHMPHGQKTRIYNGSNKYSKNGPHKKYIY